MKRGENQMKFLKIPIDKPLTHVSSGHFVSPINWSHSKRNIDSFVLIVGLQGTAYIQQDKEKYEVKPGNVLILLPYTTHFGYEISKESVSYYWCHFYCKNSSIVDESTFTKELFVPKIEASIHNDCNYVMVPIYSSYTNTDRINILFNQLLHVAYSDYYTSYGASYLLTLIMMELTQQTISDHIQKLKDDETNGKFIKMLEWIRINIENNISVCDIAREFNYNPDYLSRMFKQKIGISLIKYINSLKITKAKKMLLCSDNSIKEIAYKLGFTDEKYFMKLFKKMENITPTQYRNAFFYTHMNNH
ncbi:transcriptional regulator, AraC family [Caldicoprobacter faecalis]|uniref:Transcriptional regulator, AraC family n=2 Tax=Caldicoprobacter faecalis TaxID=937334 RepID=A0A1I5WYY4_9FIRM|nr:transcriptional regulator, AraC family [Caldicoprobacter faecalis]